MNESAQRIGIVKTVVKDNGIGLSDADQQKMFLPYSQVNPINQSFKGTGLGYFLTFLFSLFFLIFHN